MKSPFHVARVCGRSLYFKCCESFVQSPSSCFLSGYLPGPDKETRLPGVSALNNPAACSLGPAGQTLTVKQGSQHCRCRCVCGGTARGGDGGLQGLENKWINVLLFVTPRGQRQAKSPWNVALHNNNNNDNNNNNNVCCVIF